MPILRLARSAVPRQSVPPVCLVTGHAAGVEWRRVTLGRTHPAVIVGGLFFGGPIGACLAALLIRRRLSLELPFTDEGLALFERAKLLRTASLIASIVLVVAGAIGPVTAGGDRWPDAVLYLYIAACTALPVVVWLIYSGHVPQLARVDAREIELWIPEPHRSS